MIQVSVPFCEANHKGFSDPRNIFSALLLLFLFGFLYSAFKYQRWGLIVSFFWIALPYLPVSHVFVTIGTLVAERTLYIPSIGFVLLLSRLLISLPNLFPFSMRLFSQKPYELVTGEGENKTGKLSETRESLAHYIRKHKQGFTLFTILLSIGAVLTYNRTEDWKTVRKRIRA